MKSIVIYHNPKCSKSRKALEYIKNKNITPKIKLYLEEEITVKEIKNLLKILSIKPIDLIRQHEEEFESYRNKELSDEEIFTLLIKYPKLIERPIVINNDKAAIGRPLENITNII